MPDTRRGVRCPPHSDRFVLRCALVLAGAAVPAPARAQDAAEGVLHVVWEDPRSAAVAPPALFYLGDGAGMIRLDVDPIVAEAGGWRALDGRAVRVRGAAFTESAGGERLARALRVRSLEPADKSGDPAASSAGAIAALAGAQPFATVLCRASDQMAVPHPASWYVEAVLGAGYPSTRDYWHEASGGRISLAGSAVYGWFDLGRPRGAYWLEGDSTRWDLPRLAHDCAAAADASVDFAAFSGVNFQFGFPMPASFGGTSTTVLDGVPRAIRTTWLAGWAGRWAYAHEMAHTFGLPHSSGPYGATYDSKWDLMSGYLHYDPALVDWIPQHTIAPYKGRLGWIAPERRHEPAAGSRTTVALGPTALAHDDGGALLIEVPLAREPGVRYTLEARRDAGYDAALAAAGVILHRVDEDCFGSLNRACAKVVDVDGNGDPNDQGALFTAGEAFSDTLNGVSFSIDAQAEWGWTVTVTRGWPVTVSPTEGGRIASLAAGIDCAAGSCTTIVPTAGALQLTAFAADGFAFAEWAGDCTGTNPVCTLAVGSAHEVRARFVTTGPRLSIQGEGSGGGRITGPGGIECQVSGGTSIGTCSAAFDPDVLVALTATAEPGSAFAGWSGPCVPSGAICVAWMAAARSIRASFAPGAVTPPGLTAGRIIDAVLGRAALSADEAEVVDAVGNRNGGVDLGDVVAWRRTIERATPAREPAP